MDNNDTETPVTTVTYYAVCHVGGPISVALGATESEARAAWEALDGRAAIDGQSTDLEDAHGIEGGDEMAWDEFDAAIESLGGSHVEHLDEHWSLWAVPSDADWSEAVEALERAPGVAEATGRRDGRTWAREVLDGDIDPRVDELAAALASPDEPDETLIDALSTRDLRRALGVRVWDLDDRRTPAARAALRAYNAAWRAGVESVLDSHSSDTEMP